MMQRYPLNVTTLHCINSSLHTYSIQKKIIGELKIASTSHVTFEYIKGTDDISADSISHLRSVCLYDSFDPEGGGKEFGHNIFEELPSINAESPTQVE